MTTHVFNPLPGPPSPDNDNAVVISNLFANSGPNTTILLQPRVLYVIYTPINFIHSNNHLATHGYPPVHPDYEDDQAIIETRGEKESTAVNMHNLVNVSLRRIHIRGCRGWGRTNPSPEEANRWREAEGAMGWLEGGGALVLIGGPLGRDSIIEGCRLTDPRGWTACHVADFAERISLVSNLIGPAGQEAPGGPWADGISIAGRDSFISNNTIFDATDGAIVIFCAPGSTIIGNKIISRNRDLLGAINLVDEFPFACDFTNTRVLANEISTEGDAFIHLGIGIGSTCWGPWTPDQKLNFGGSVNNNIIGPGTLGYGIALSTAKDFTVLSNTILPSAEFRGDNAAVPNNAPPLALLVDRKRILNCHLQDDFVEADGNYLIGIRNGFSKSIRFENGQIDLRSGGIGIQLAGATFRLDENSQFILQETTQHGQRLGDIIWSSNSQHSKSPSRVVFNIDGHLMIVSMENNQILWNPADYTSSSNEDPSSRSSLRLSSTSPYLTLMDASNNLIYASSYEFPRDVFGLSGGDWISIAPISLRGNQNIVTVHQEKNRPQIPEKPEGLGRFKSMIKDFSQSALSSAPAIPPRPTASSPSTQPTYLFISPITAQIILHSSPVPNSPIDSAIHWISPLSHSTARVNSSRLVFQGDGNMVLYVEREGGGGAEFGTGSNGDEDHAGFKITLSNVNEGGGASMKILDKHGRTRWET